MAKISIRKALVVAAALAFASATSGGIAVAAKKTAAQKCQQQIDKAVQKYTKKKLQKLFKCGKKNADDASPCLGSAKPSVSLKLSKKAKKACTDAIITGDPGDNGLGFTSCATDATSGCPANKLVSNSDTLQQCLQCSHDFETDCLFGVVYNVAPSACTGD